MHPRFERSIHFLAGITLALAAPLATAQVQLNLTTAQQQNCTAVTNAQGLQLAADGVNLQATGVTLSGNGCGGNSDYQVAVSSPPNVVAGTQFNVTWSATAAATQCYYNGTAGVTGWPIGASACSGAACAGTHTPAVTVSSAGSYTFSVICTNASGTASASSTATGGGGPPTPNGFALTAPATATTGTPFSVSWSVNGATACSGSASRDGSSASLPGWTDSTSPTSPRSVTASVAGTYTLQLVCSNASPGNATSQQATVVVDSGVDPDSCPAGRLTVASIKYPNIPSSGTRNNMDLTKFENIWGHMNSVDNATLWPGSSGTQPAIIGWGKTQYVAAKFHVPAGQSTATYGFLGYATYFSGPALTVAISSTCGDFTPSNPQCVSTHSTGESFSKWRIVPATLNCPLTRGQDYFVNMRMASPTPEVCAPVGQTTTACTLATNNTFVN